MQILGQFYYFLTSCWGYEEVIKLIHSLHSQKYPPRLGSNTLCGMSLHTSSRHTHLFLFYFLYPHRISDLPYFFHYFYTQNCCAALILTTYPFWSWNNNLVFFLCVYTVFYGSNNDLGLSDTIFKLKVTHTWEKIKCTALLESTDIKIPKIYYYKFLV